MNNKEREAIVQAITAMNETEKRVVLECIPVHLMLEYIDTQYRQQETIINGFKATLNEFAK